MRPTTRLPAATLAALLAIPAASTHAAVLPAATSAVGAAIEPAVARLAERGVIGEAPLSVFQPARVHYELGALLEVRDGLARVVAVRPGDAAEAAGLAVGDRIDRLNGAPVAAGRAVQEALVASEGRFVFEGERDGRALRVEGAAVPVRLPAWRLEVASAVGVLPQVAADAEGRPLDDGQGCGYISTSREPPRSDGLFRVALLRVDGESTPLTRQPPRHRVPAGRRVLLVGERVPPVFLGVREGRDRNLQASRDLEFYRRVEIDVRPGMRYELAARLRPRDERDIRGNEYWDVVVWSEREEACR